MSDALILDEINEGETILFLLKKMKIQMTFQEKPQLCTIYWHKVCDSIKYGIYAVYQIKTMIIAMTYQSSN